MGTVRGHTPHWTPARGLTRPRSPRPCAHPSPAFITPVLLPLMSSVGLEENRKTHMVILGLDRVGFEMFLTKRSKHKKLPRGSS